jgi:hypothetical protein
VSFCEKIYIKGLILNRYLTGKSPLASMSRWLRAIRPLCQRGQILPLAKGGTEGFYYNQSILS